MNRRFRTLLFVFCALVLVPVVVDATLQQERAQIGVVIDLSVTGAVAKAPVPAPATGSAIVADLVLNKSEDPSKFHAENVGFIGGVPGNVVAQSQAQGSVEVQASVSPNPNGTLLYSTCTGFPVGCPGVTENVTAGSLNTFSCAYQVTVDTTQTAWTLEHGLFSDFVNQTPIATPSPAGTATPPTTFSGHLLMNNSHIATPLPAYTPFIVYSDGQAWAVLNANGGKQTYCIDLEINVPITVENGTYSSQAVYTLYY